ncbi:ArnT family glycosyltransferase [Promineifilum sp.]|uniref:ArnT family glycosyltransferase n=1 Tax=Promineifilum sp. TaxID=2664178 RepID=UPI0035B31AAB
MTRRRLLLSLILIGYLVITLAYGAINPLFEAPDEHWHFFTAEAIARNGRLPVVEEPPDEWLGQEAAQPPLYYLLGAALIAPIDTEGARDAIWLNPYAWIGDASALANVNRIVHTPAEAWPWQGYALAAHLLRVLSTLLGLGTLLAIYASGRRLWPASTTRPLLATALVAFLPQFNFVHASVSNDPLITFLCSLGLYQLIGLWREPPGVLDKRAVGRLVLLGVTVGMAALSKNAGVLLLVYSLGFLAVLALRERRPRLIWQAALAVGGPAVLIAGWLWARNQSLYGDWTATNRFIAIAGGDRGYTLWQVLGESHGLSLSLVAVFGWFNLRAPQWVYLSWLAIVVLALLGALSCFLSSRGESRGAGEQGSRGKEHVGQSRHSPPLPSSPAPPRSDHLLALLLAGWVILVYAGLATFMMRTEAAQGRLLFPAILPAALGVAWGLAGWGDCMPRGLGAINRRLSPLLALLALATTIYCLLFIIQPAYQPPGVVNALPDDVRRVLPELTDRGQGLTLLGARVETETARPGDVVWLTLYWRADDVVADAPEFIVELYGRDVERIANLHSYHGRGLYPATLWPQGAIIADRFAVRIEPEAEAPVLGRIFARVNGGAPGIEVATVKITPHTPPPAPDAWLAEIGDHIALVATNITPAEARPGQIVYVEARWYVPRGTPQRDYTTLIHLGQPDRPPLSTGDSPPLGGDYPTRAWSNGETIDDRYELVIPADLAAGRYPIWIGMYDPASGTRLPVTVEGELQPNGVYLAGWLDVTCGPQDIGCDE